jgi:hypothetical protein
MIGSSATPSTVGNESDFALFTASELAALR